ncbi:MAG: 50S ribosomal protein L24 [Parcubacteria group bacterium GW2011_GWD2_38_12]|uniref:Large ribosomal subunit protein uL24 n=1 Tax=Candidatus Azambacteria bacterium RIFCSPLOWO2_01_FULL_37_9 TaxID=1797297 RepID=A0A1F5C6F1_9BACT|nr:MAG: 50S ribosomal protein L24 [Parcubacteria group bacterium GW2011_GWC2_36_17]KKQ39096.1 MAG: 50S ribosomal protein L24 [Candidatus Moranbacteria bacterium GW2011_GWF2_37_7]KKQ43566.1 MAG: 50S ribosomal protein L24 [Parcubacteria group bacterium GW2011_GWE2_37_8]KKQ52181.1 MAG: 50S ribosomal protein L24 [Parcubacteria group bacterium GW2011_GWD2_38_12]KKQ58224.1 MAG: 50S ribosomal protein L24 [Parcubacteria group bacterium GW2011_GWD1_38_16]KKQ58907.1 MAG: 50S ribosomal protein L24 [Parcu
MKIKKEDNILIMIGKDKGKQAKVSKVYPMKNMIVAEGINIKKKHQGPKKQGQKGSIIQFPAPFNASNAMLVCPKCSKPTRVGYKISEGGKARVCKKCKAEI